MEATNILDCGHPPSSHSDFTTGYGEDSEGKKSCYDCCAANDRRNMIETGKATLYLAKNEDYKEHLGNIDWQPRYFITNWPGSLKLHATAVRTGSHNIAGKRYDAWFNFEDGYVWHGTQYGDNTQICHCKRTRQRWKEENAK
jgi:hypothetical protein